MSRRQWIDLGIHDDVCMPRPHTCGAEGGSISLWMRVIRCPDIGGILTSISQSNSGRFVVFCARDYLG